MIPVTKTFLPPKEEYDALIQKIWDTNQIANGGPLHQELCQALNNSLATEYIILTANGTLPIQIALMSLAAEGEVITTPFSYIATTSAIIWQNCTPVFVDIDPVYLTINENKIEEAITPKTTAILATHVFGNPCDTEKIQELANKYRLKVIYDAAHAFGVKYKGKSLFNYGDVSTCSFHATKIFHTGEGGAIFSQDQQVFEELFYRHNFGHKGSLEYHGLGINAKMSDLQAAMGLAVLPYVKDLIKNRKELIGLYEQNLDFNSIGKIKIRKDTEWNYSYFPILVENEKVLLKILKVLKTYNIFPRRYFYPSLNTLHFLNSTKMPVSEDVSRRVLCLPLYQGLKSQEVEMICRLINKEMFKH
ncbi:DegT/DnrJ/EryC1/StrS family aminotransferase [Christiangramia sp.]|uniref:DegT/DnrJ/EryC1/StrS family aminotransferase n=1 Tax=Christiangramia sp. TaxID=1931228 RepID=UPI0026271B16|nr:DegT/DnrJ/EryC1/StrS family aminotransferase [Christiangramia sp.]